MFKYAVIANQIIKIPAEDCITDECNYFIYKDTVIHDQDLFDSLSEAEERCDPPGK